MDRGLLLAREVSGATEPGSQQGPTAAWADGGAMYLTVLVAG